jgi:hypothetical protein
MGFGSGDTFFLGSGDGFGFFASFLSFTGCVYFLGCYFAGFLFSYFTFNGSSGMSMSLTSTSSPNIAKN